MWIYNKFSNKIVCQIKSFEFELKWILTNQDTWSISWLKSRTYEVDCSFFSNRSSRFQLKNYRKFLLSAKVIRYLILENSELDWLICLLSPLHSTGENVLTTFVLPTTRSRRIASNFQAGNREKLLSEGFS